MGASVTRTANGGALWSFVSVLSLLLLWVTVSSLQLFDPVFLPSPKAVLQSARELISSGELQQHVGASLGRVLAGFCAGAAAGVVVGALMGGAPQLHRFLTPVVEVIRPLPALALIPLVLVWFGIGEAGKVAVIGYGVFIPVFTNTLQGVVEAPVELRRAAINLGAGRLRLVLKVLLPAALPQITSGLIVGMSQAFSILVAAELIAASVGLGFMIEDARRFFRTDLVVLGMVAIGALGWALIAVLRAARRALLPWHHDSESTRYA